MGMTSSSHHVCALGNAIVDILSPCDDSFLTREDIRKGSMTLIDRQRARHLTNLAHNPDMVSGGSAANTISGLVALGARGAFIGKVASDALGKVFHDDLVKNGVAYRTPYYATGDLETARCHIFVTPDGERSMNTYLGASTEFTAADLDKDLIEGSLITYLEGYLFDKDAAREAFEQGAAIAKAAGRKVAMTLSDSWCVDRHRPEFQKLVKDQVDILFANEAELCALSETDNVFDAVAALSGKVELLAVTRSEKGAIVVTDEDTVEIPTTPVKVTDATGAGDQFAAGFLYGLTHNMPLAQCGSLGCRMATHVIQVIGPRLTEDPKPWLASTAA